MEKLKRTTARMRFFKQTSVNAELRQAFDVFDKDGNGYVDRHELRTTMRELGVDLTSDDVTAMMEEAGVRVDGRIYLEGKLIKHAANNLFNLNPSNAEATTKSRRFLKIF